MDNTDYLHKYLKYKNKYLHLKNQVGGTPEWLNDEFLKGVVEIYGFISENFGSENTFITGSTALVLLAHVNGINLPTDYPRPNDVDFMIVKKGLFNSSRMGPFVRKQDTPERSVTYQIEGDEPFYFRSTDMSAVSRMRRYHTVEIRGIPINIQYIKSISENYDDMLESEITEKGVVNHHMKINLMKILNKMDLPYEEEAMDVGRRTGMPRMPAFGSPPRMGGLFGMASAAPASPTSPVGRRFDFGTPPAAASTRDTVPSTQDTVPSTPPRVARRFNFDMEE